MKAILTVIIPTIGRSQINETVKRILSEFGEEEVNIILIPQTSDVFTKLNRSYADFKNIQVFMSRKIGVSSALNEGLQNWNDGTWLSIFSDDDVWEFGRKELIMRELESQRKSERILIGSCEFQRNLHYPASKRIPTIAPTQSPIRYVYPSFRGIFRSNYLTLTSMLISFSEVIPDFRTSLKSREDLCWLEQLHQIGYEFVCEPSYLLSKVDSGYDRTILRDNPDEIRNWLSTLESLGLNNVSFDFLSWHLPKPFIRLGKTSSIWRNFKEFGRRYNENFFFSVLILVFQLILTLFFRIRILLKR